MDRDPRGLDLATRALWHTHVNCMTSSTGLSWSRLHDFSLIYLALTYGDNGEVGASEDETIFQVLRRRHPKAESESIQRALHEALLVYIGATSGQMLEISVEALAQALGRDQRLAILEDLADIAAVDGQVAPADVAFIQQLARRWNVDQEL